MRSFTIFAAAVWQDSNSGYYRQMLILLLSKRSSMFGRCRSRNEQHWESSSSLEK